MKVAYHPQFLKHFQKRILPKKKLVTRFNHRFQIFIEDRSNPELKDHRLVGKIGQYRSFSITGDIRVIYKMEGKVVTFYDIGTHNQVY